MILLTNKRGINLTNHSSTFFEIYFAIKKKQKARGFKIQGCST